MMEYMKKYENSGSNSEYRGATNVKEIEAILIMSWRRMTNRRCSKYLDFKTWKFVEKFNLSNNVN